MAEVVSDQEIRLKGRAKKENRQSAETLLWKGGNRETLHQENSHPEASSRHVSEDPDDDDESFTEYVLKPHEEMEILDGWAKIKSPVRFALKARVLKKTETWEVMKNLKAENKVKYIYVLC